MQEPKQDLVVDEDATIDKVELPDDMPPQQRSPWRFIIWTIVVLLIVGFAIFGVTTLQHHPPLDEKSTGFVQSLLALQPTGSVLYIAIAMIPC